MIAKVRDLPLYDVNNFFRYYERWVPECQRLLALDQSLRVTPTRWWGTYKKNIRDWKKCRRFMWVRFGQLETELIDKYDGQNDPKDHIQLFIATWGEILRGEWVHGFIHRLETIPQNWYLETKLQHGTACWAEMVHGFIITFIFEDDYPNIDAALNIVKKKIFENEVPVI